jgi:Zn-dependent protease with chaperone function
MSPTILLPLSGVLIAILLLRGAVQRHLRPRAATRALTGVAVGSALATIWALALVVFGSAISQRRVEMVATWCRVSAPDHHPIALWLGVAAGAALMTGAIRAAMVLGRHLRSDATWRRDCGVEIIDSLEPVAFAVPGRPGTVIVSTAMLAALRPGERDAMLAHEQAHLRWNHHRYIRATEMAAAFLPPLGSLVRRVRFETERWADEDAATFTSNRTVVASAVARAALASTGPTHLAMGRIGVQERVEALLRPRPVVTWFTNAALLMSCLAVVVGLGSATLELHHLVTFADHICSDH